MQALEEVHDTEVRSRVGPTHGRSRREGRTNREMSILLRTRVHVVKENTPHQQSLHLGTVYRWALK